MGSATYLGGTHLDFYEVITDKKTKTLDVLNITLGENIGEIHWRGGWRQYVFQAKPGIDMSRSCMREIIKKIDELMEEWRDKRK